MWLLLLFCFFQLFAQVNSPKNEDDQKKQAQQWFDDEEYGKAYSLYSNLLANNPKDPKYNYRVGVCILYVGDEKGERKRAIRYLEIAKKNISDLDKEVVFYLAKAYHLNYRFDEAIRTYTEYKNLAGAANIKKLQVDREIESARSGKRQLVRARDLVVLEKKRLSAANYYKSYEQSFYGGNLLVKLDQFKLTADKKKKDQFILFQSKDRNLVLFASYGETGDKGKDIYMARRMPNGEFAKPFPLPGFVNTEYDEDYPYLHPNGKTLFFCSKGHNSMGGYDIFKSTWDEERQVWSRPENLEFPINTPADDIQFVTDSLGKLAIFSSTRISEFGKIDVYKINMERKPMESALIAGSVMQKDESASKVARITVKDMENGENYGPFVADPNGFYSLKIPNGGKFIFTVETSGFPTQSESVAVPTAYDLRPYKQIITYQDKKLVIQNQFELKEDEQNYEKMITVLEEASKLDPNSDKFKEDNFTKTNVANANSNNSSASTDPNTNTNQGTSTIPDKKNITNAELIQLATKDLEDVKKESNELKLQSDNATKLAISVKEEADRKTNEANEALTKLQNTTHPANKQRAQEDYNNKKSEADKYNDISNKAQNIANSLKVDADNKKKEEQLQEKLVKAMNDVNSSPNNQAKLDILTNITKELKDHQEKTKDLKYDDFSEKNQAEIDRLETTLTSLNTNRNGIKKEIDQINSDIKEKNEELKQTDDKDLATNIKEELKNLESEKTEKIKDLKTADTKLDNTQNEIEKLKSQQAIADKVLEQSKTGSTDLNTIVAVAGTNNTNKNSTDNSTNPTDVNTTVNTNTTTATTNTTTANASTTEVEKDVFAEKQNLIKEKLSNLNSTQETKENLQEKQDVLSDYNKTIEEKIKEDKVALKSTKDNDEKSRLNAEIKELEKLKADNSKMIAEAKTKMKSAPSNADIVNTTNTTTTTTTDSGNPTVNVNNTDVTTDENSFSSRENAFKEKLAELDTAKAKEDYSVKINVLSEYNKSIDEQIKANKADRKETTDKTEKKRLDEENLALEQKKKDNFTQIAVAKKEQQSAPTREELLAQNSSTNSTDVTDVNTIGTNTTSAVSTNNNNGSSSITDENKSSNDVENSTVAVLSNVEYTNPAADEQKKAALKKLQEIEEENRRLTNPVAVSVVDDQKQKQFQEQQNAIDKTNSEAENLQSQARTIRNDAKNKSGTEKEKLLADAKKLEEQAIDKRIDASEDQIKLSENQITENNRVISEFKSNGKSNQEVTTEVQRLEEEIKRLDKKADSFITEANNQTDDGQKLGSYTNAGEIEDEMIAAQEKIIKLYSSSGNSSGTPDDEQVKQKLEENKKESAESYTQLTVANKEEYKSIQTKLNDAQKKFGNKKDPDAAQWKKDATTLVKQADALIGKAKTEKDADRKNELLRTALEKQDSALFLANKAIVKYEGGDVMAYDNTYSSRKSGNDNANANNNSNSDSNTTDSNASITDENKTVTNSNASVNTTTDTNTSTSASNLSPERIEEVKKSPEYQLYTGYVNKANKAFTDADKDQQQSKKYMDEATTTMKLSNDKRTEADKLPEGAKKQQLKNESIQLEQKAVSLKQKADSLNEMASNTRSFANEQKMLADDYASTLDQKKLDEIKNVSGTNSGSVSNTGDNSSGTVSAHTQEFIETTTRYDEQLKTIGESENDEAAINSRVQVWTSYVSDIENEILQVKNEISSTTDENKKTALNNELNRLNQLRTEKKNALAADIKRRDDLKNNNQGVTTTATNTTTTVGTNTATATTNTNPDNSSGTNTTNATRVITSNGLKVSNANAYNDANPIPIDKKWPDGIVFTVQVGAFKTPVPNSTFKGLTPVNATTAPNGFIRYQAGMFTDFSEANAAKNDMRKVGFKDAFVAVYKNGQRIAMADLIKENNTIVVSDNSTSVGIATDTNVPDGGTIVTTNPENSSPVNATEINKTGGLFYTVQVGVYSDRVSSKQLLNIEPVYREPLPNGNFRYTAGTYNSLERVKSDRAKVNQLGIRDAFVSAYLDGQRISVAEAMKKQGDALVKMFPENPIRFPANNNIAAPENIITPAVVTNTTTTTEVFSNGVTNDPVPTAENGVKLSSAGIVYKIQIGVYSKAVPENIAANWMKIKTWPIRNFTNDKGLIIYTVGSFGDFKNARKLLEQATADGITDAFITVYKDGKRLYGAEASPYLR